MSNIPVSQTNLGGNKVSDLVEALLKLDQDTRLNGIDFVKSSGDVLVIGMLEDTWLDAICDSFGRRFQGITELCDYLHEAEDNEEIILKIKKLL